MADSPTILSCLCDTVRRLPDRPAVSDAGRTLTYRQLWCEAEAYAQEDRTGGAGVEAACANLVEARPSVDFVVAAIGTRMANRIFVPYAKDMPAEVLTVLRAETGTISATAPGAARIAEILYTTGTTGRSKGVMLSDRALWASADAHCHVDRSTEDAVWLIASPLNHIGPLQKLYSCFLVGAHAVLHEGYADLKRYYETIERHRVNALFLPPSAVAIILSLSRDRLRALSGRIREVYSSGAPMPESVRASLRRYLQEARLIIAYGATECAGACCAYDDAEFPGRSNCVGRPSPHAKIAVEDGCLVVSGDGVMEGYLNDPVRTSAVLRGGSVHTNDCGFLDADGFVHVTGRKDDVINCGGLKVSPSEVEEVVMCYPGVLDCVCFGVADRIAGSAVNLRVVPEDTRDFDLVAFRRFLCQRLERHQIPTHVSLASEIPKTPNGKTDRKRLSVLADGRV